MNKTIFSRIRKAAYSSVMIGIMGVGLFGMGIAPGFHQSDLQVVNAAADEAAEISKYIVCPDSLEEEEKDINDETAGMPVCENWLKASEIHDDREASALVKRGAAVSDAVYDPRNVNGVSMVSAVRDQGENDTCWAFATVAAMESNLIKKGLADASIDLSENQFAYFFYNRQTDKLGYTAGDYNRGNRQWNENGGTLLGSGMAITTWAGVTTESRSPYISVPDNSLCYDHDYSARNVIFYNYDVKNLEISVNKIKQAVVDYGAVATGMYIGLPYFNSKNGAYYCNKKDGNHAVTIVGWDDGYSRNNFGSIKPTKDGAWIVKNSYGINKKYSGDNGYLYISYEDASLTEMMSVDAVPVSEQYDNNYQYDGTANPMMSIGLPSGAKYANVFKANASSATCEELKAVGVCTFSTNVSYEVQVYTGLTSAGKPTSGTKAFSSAVKGSFSEAGYQTITLPSSVALVPGEYFSIVVTLKKSSGAPYIALDTSGSAAWISFDAAVSKNQSFAYYNKKWVDLSKMTDNGYSKPSNLRIKAYTDITENVPGFKLSSTSMGISKGNSSTLSLKKNLSNIYRNVTWSSSNTKVATVGSKGKVTGKSYGSAVISASFMKGSKKTTLKCKVTVGPSKVKEFRVTGGNGSMKLNWKKNSAADGYEVYYATDKNGDYQKLATAKNGKSKSSQKLNSGTYYVKMRAYKLKGKKKLYGSFTAAKQVVVQ